MRSQLPIEPGDQAQNALQHIVIVGGGTAGWITASMLVRAIGTSCKITVIESADIPTVGVGEATIPSFLDLLRFLSINEADFIKHTQATYKLAIRFKDWQREGHDYWHPFGNFGVAINMRPFESYWLKSQALNYPEGIDQFCPTLALALANKFAFPDYNAAFPDNALNYALHFDAGLVAKYLRSYAEQLGVMRLVQTVTQVDAAQEHIEQLHCADGTRVSADFYIDCTGFGGMLIDKALHSNYVDWSDYLPVNAAVAVPSEPVTPLTPYTTATAKRAGWQWRIALQNRVGNGYVYSREHVSDDEAAAILLAGLDAPALAEPRFLRFTTGYRKRSWVGNCVAVGLSAGFIEPLESTSIHLIISAVHKFLDYFPNKQSAPDLVSAFNIETEAEFEHIRDFILLHYALNQRVGQPFWNEIRQKPLPESLRAKITFFKTNGRLISRKPEIFSPLGWFFILSGMGVRPERHDPLIDVADFSTIRKIMMSLKSDVQSHVARAVSH